MNSLTNLCCIELTNSESNFIGIIVNKGTLEIIFPRGYDLSTDELSIRKDILLLLKVFNKYKLRKGNKILSEDDDFIFHGTGESFPFASALWLIKNYESNGLYNEYTKCYKFDKKGDVDWAKTIKTHPPFINNNNFVYLDFIVKENKNNLNNIIMLIQKYIIEQSIKAIGWLYPNICIDKGNKLPYPVKTCINLLRKELKLSNLDNKKQLLKNMLDFLKYVGDDQSNSKFKEYKTKYFSNIWEDMLKVVLGNEDESKYFPNAVWNINNKPVNASRLRPDIIMKLENNIYVLDAKYYKYGITKNPIHLPQSSDITKQLLYSSHITSNTNSPAYDAFILPTNSNGSNIFEFVGNATVDINTLKNKKVVAILADIKTIMELYISPTNLDTYKYAVKNIIDSQLK